MLWKSDKRVEVISQLCKKNEADLLLGAEHRTDIWFAEEEQKIENILVRDNRVVEEHNIIPLS